MKPLRETGDEAARSPFARSAAGFTLIEFIGVLAILAIIAAAVVPTVVRRVDRGALAKEYGDLAAISNAIALNALRTWQLPDASSGASGWGPAAANWLNRPLIQITNTPRAFSRSFLIDPNMTWLPLPYAQTNNTGLASQPTSARIILVSTIARTSPPVTNGISAADFNAVWDTLPNTKPATTAIWTMNGDDICIQRINLAHPCSTGSF